MTATALEKSIAFPCFGGIAAVWVAGDGNHDAELADARRALEGWHHRFTRFEPTSELSLLNADPARTVRVSDVMCRFVAAALDAARLTGGLVDATLLTEIEAAGYTSDLPRAERPDARADPRPPRTRARASRHGGWREIAVDRRRGTVSRPLGVRLDSGGIAKGLFADLVAERLALFDAFAVDCGGDLRVGGRRALPRTVCVDDPHGGGCLHEFEVIAGGIATSGIQRRAWRDAAGRPAHHLLDPRTGLPAFTGVVQATALAPTALEAEALAKAALLSGPGGARGWLSHGGLIVFDDGSHEVVEQIEVAAAPTHR